MNALPRVQWIRARRDLDPSRGWPARSGPRRQSADVAEARGPERAAQARRGLPRSLRMPSILCFAFFSLSSASFLSRSASSSSPFPNLLLRMRLMELTGGGRRVGARTTEPYQAVQEGAPEPPARTLERLPCTTRLSPPAGHPRPSTTPSTSHSNPPPHNPHLQVRPGNCGLWPSRPGEKHFPFSLYRRGSRSPI